MGNSSGDLDSKWPTVWSRVVSRMVYFEVQWPVILGYLGFPGNVCFVSCPTPRPRTPSSGEPHLCSAISREPDNSLETTSELELVRPELLNRKGSGTPGHCWGEASKKIK